MFLVERELRGLSEPSSAILYWTGVGLFPSVDEEVFLEVLLASEVLVTGLARIGPNIQVRDIDMSTKVELG